jgi:hypothetical protein
MTTVEKEEGRMNARVVLVLLGIALLSPRTTRAEEPDAQTIARITGLQPDVKNGTATIRVPRKDLGAAVDGVSMDPFQGLTSWAAFQGAGNHTMVMGDLTLAQEEVNPAMSAALEHGLEVTALHNHFFYDRPNVFFMHIGGTGTTEQLAVAVRTTLDAVASVAKSKGVKGACSERVGGFAGPAIPTKSALDLKSLEGILGPSNATKDGMVKFVFGKKTSMHGTDVGAAMGVNTWAVFSGTPKVCVVDGDFAMLQGEVQGVLKALRNAGLNIVALHNHMTDEEPRIVFLHFWGKGPAEGLARGFKAALDTQQK